jgi:hypothetical protein
MASAGTAISTSNEGPAVNLTVWISLVVSSLAVLLKVTSKVLRNQRSIKLKNWGVDDYTIMTSVVCPLIRPWHRRRHLTSLRSLPWYTASSYPRRSIRA